MHSIKDVISTALFNIFDFENATIANQLLAVKSCSHVN